MSPRPRRRSAPDALGLSVSVDRAALVEALVTAKAALPTRPAAPVLAGILLEGTETGELIVSSFDYEVSTRIRLPAFVVRPGAMLLHGKLLHDVLKKSRGTEVHIWLLGSKAVIEPGPSRFELQTLPVQDYPALPDMPETGGTVFASQFLAAVKKVMTAVGKDDTIPMLTGIRIEFGPESMTLIATDRFRLAVAKIPWYPDDPVAEHPPLLLHTGMLKAIGSRWKAATGRIRIGTDAAENGGVVGLALGNETCTARLMSGEFVKFRSLFAEHYPFGVVVEAAPLKAAAELITLVAERTSPIRLAFAPGEVTLRAGAGDEAQGRESVPAIYHGAPFQVSLNPYFLLDGLGMLGREFVRLSITRPSKPLVLTGHHSPTAAEADGVRYLMMPLRVPGQGYYENPGQVDYTDGKAMLPWHAAEFQTDLGGGCKTRALHAAWLARRDAGRALARLERLLYPRATAEQAGAALLRNVIAEADAFTAWAKTSPPSCNPAVCRHCVGESTPAAKLAETEPVGAAGWA